MAVELSYSPDSRVDSRAVSISPSRAAKPASTSGMRDSSSSSLPISHRVIRSSQADRRLAWAFTLPSRLLMRFWTFWALSTLSQKPSAADWA